MANRDAELDDVTRRLRADDPYIEKPDEVQVDIGGACFLDDTRVCGPACTAFFNPRGATAAERCTILNAATHGLELLEELVQLRRSQPRTAVPEIAPPYISRSGT